MNRIIVLAVCVPLLLLSSVPDMGLIATVSASTTRHVYSGESIQGAINSAQPGDTIFVHAGTYYENVVVNKTVSLIGENRHDTVIDGNGAGTVINITVNNVKISGFTIRKSGPNYPDSGIRVDYSSGNNISHNVVANNFYGISLYSSSNNTLTGNNASDNWIGIRLSDSSNNTISCNDVSSNNRYGIRLSHSGNNMLAGNNVSSNNWDGISLEYSGNNTLSGNTFSNNSRNFGIWGDDFFHFNNYVDMNNTVDGKPVYYLMGVANAVCDTQTEAGTIYLINCENITIRDLTLTKNGHGIFFWNTTNSKIENVTVSNNRYGIVLGYSSNNTITGNNVSSNELDGIRLGHSSNNKITGNTVSNNEYGIVPDYSSNNIYHNNFVNNRNQAYVTQVYTNAWDDAYPSGGNYWSDYSGVDVYGGPYQNVTGSDGIGDTGYVIDADNVDHYPLVKPYGAQHDIGIGSVTTSKTILVRGYNLHVNITIINYGNNTENFNVTAYANTTVIAAFTNITLTSRNSTTVTFTWNTTSVPYGNYTMSATATPVPGETETTDNTCAFWVVVTVVGDVDGDGVVNILDVKLVKLAYSLVIVLPSADIDDNGVINILDVKRVKLIYSGI